MNIPPEFCFNADESCFIDFVDIKKQSVIVPIDAPDDMVRGTCRSTKRASLIGTICMYGSNFKPLIVVPNKRIKKELILAGHSENNLLIVQQENGFVNSNIFSCWADQIFFPAINQRRSFTIA